MKFRHTVSSASGRGSMVNWLISQIVELLIGNHILGGSMATYLLNLRLHRLFVDYEVLWI